MPETECCARDVSGCIEINMRRYEEAGQMRLPFKARELAIQGPVSVLRNLTE